MSPNLPRLRTSLPPLTRKHLKSANQAIVSRKSAQQLQTAIRHTLYSQKGSKGFQKKSMSDL